MAELLKESERSIKRAIRDLERVTGRAANAVLFLNRAEPPLTLRALVQERANLEKREKQMQKDIKANAQKGQMVRACCPARSLVTAVTTLVTDPVLFCSLQPDTSPKTSYGLETR